MNQVDILLARAQVGLAFFFAVAFCAALAVLILGWTGLMDLPEAAMQMLVGMASVLGTIVTQQQGYFFARQRPATIPEPAPAPAPTPVPPTP